MKEGSDSEMTNKYSHFVLIIIRDMGIEQRDWYKEKATFTHWRDLIAQLVFDVIFLHHVALAEAAHAHEASPADRLPSPCHCQVNYSTLRSITLPSNATSKRLGGNELCKMVKKYNRTGTMRLRRGLQMIRVPVPNIYFILTSSSRFTECIWIFFPNYSDDESNARLINIKVRRMAEKNSRNGSFFTADCIELEKFYLHR